MKFQTRIALVAVGLIGSICSIGNATNLYDQKFDTDTVSTGQTVATYGVTVIGLSNAIVQSGQLYLSTPSGVQGSLDFSAFIGDLTIAFDTSTVGESAGINTGLRVGDNRYIFHPGYLNGAFRIEGPGGHDNVDMGFTPTNSALNHMTVSIQALTGFTSIKIVDGENGHIYQETFSDTNYVDGLTMIGFSTGSSGGPRSAVFDNLNVSAVPELSSWALLLFGLGALGNIVHRCRI